jgi:chromate transport protein ChrA
MFLLEYLFLVKIYKKESIVTPFRLLLPPVLLIVAQMITYQIQDKKNKENNRINPFILFFIFILLKLPFTFNQYDLIENISLFERMMILGIEAVSATLIAEGILALIQ